MWPICYADGRLFPCRLPKPPTRTFGMLRIFPEKMERFRRDQLEAYMQELLSIPEAMTNRVVLSFVGLVSTSRYLAGLVVNSFDEPGTHLVFFSNPLVIPLWMMKRIALVSSSAAFVGKFRRAQQPKASPRAITASLKVRGGRPEKLHLAVSPA